MWAMVAIPCPPPTVLALAHSPCFPVHPSHSTCSGEGWTGVTAAIVRARSPRQVDGWIAAASLELTAADLEEIVNAIKFTGAGTSPKIPMRPHVQHKQVA